MSETKILKAQLQDLDDLYYIESKTFSSDKYPIMSKKNFKHLLLKGHCDILLAQKNNIPCGTAVIFYRKNSSYGRLYSIAVLPEFQGKEVGKLLFEKTINTIKKRKLKGIILEIRSDNIRHKKRYLDQGFMIIKTLENYYEDGCDGLKLKKSFHA